MKRKSLRKIDPNDFRGIRRQMIEKCNQTKKLHVRYKNYQRKCAFSGDVEIMTKNIEYRKVSSEEWKYVSKQNGMGFSKKKTKVKQRDLNTQLEGHSIEQIDDFKCQE